MLYNISFSSLLLAITFSCKSKTNSAAKELPESALSQKYINWVGPNKDIRIPFKVFKINTNKLGKLSNELFLQETVKQESDPTYRKALQVSGDLGNFMHTIEFLDVEEQMVFPDVFQIKVHIGEEHRIKGEGVRFRNGIVYPNLLFSCPRYSVSLYRAKGDNEEFRYITLKIWAYNHDPNMAQIISGTAIDGKLKLRLQTLEADIDTIDFPLLNLEKTQYAGRFVLNTSNLPPKYYLCSPVSTELLSIDLEKPKCPVGAKNEIYCNRR